MTFFETRLLLPFFTAYPKCLKCQSLEYCNMCLAKFYNESGGDIYKISDYFCGVSHLNREIAEEYRKRRAERIS